VGLEETVAIATHRCAGLIVGVLGILKCGASFVALDPSHPEERKAFIMQDINSQFVVTMQGVLPVLPEGVQAIILQADGQVTPRQSTDNVAQLGERAIAESHNSCYTYYTSGSTGKPKGVITEHRNTVNQLFHFQRHHPLSVGKTIFAVTTLTFDPCICEIFWPLSFGATIFMVSTPTQKKPDKLTDLLDELDPYVLQATPTLYYMLNHMGWEGSINTHVMSGGEAFPMALAPMMKKCRLFSNIYGPTETTVWATEHTVSDEAGWKSVKQVMPAGKALDNYIALVLNPNTLELCQVEEMGELFIGGAGMTRGYHNRPELNAKVFVQSPHLNITEAKYGDKLPRSALLYRTGDLFKWDLDGLLICCGREDSQVKLNGHRMELGEIEANLESHESTERVILLAREDIPGYEHTKTLVAYVQCVKGQELTPVEMREYLGTKVAPYMVPNYYMLMEPEDWPLSTSGKVMKTGLPAPTPDAGAKKGGTRLSPSAPRQRASPNVGVQVCPAFTEAPSSPLLTGGVGNTKGLPSNLEAVVDIVIDIAQNFTTTDLNRDSSLLEVGIDSFASVSFSRALSNAVAVPVTGRDLMKHSRVRDLAKHIYNAVKAEQELGSDPVSAEMQIMVNMEASTGLRGMVVLQVFWYHFHIAWPQYTYKYFGRCFDMEAFFVIMGLTAMIQNRNKSFESWSDIRLWYTGQAWKIFPMYWLLLVFLWACAAAPIGGFDTTMWYPVDTAQKTFGVFGFWVNMILSILNLHTLSTSITIQWWFNPILWFVGTMWVVATLLFPMLLWLVRAVAPIHDRVRVMKVLVGSLLCYFILWVICNGVGGWLEPAGGPSSITSANGFTVQASPYVKIFVFFAGMLVGQLLLGEAMVADLDLEAKSWIDKVSLRKWGFASDLSGFVFGFLTFGPPYWDRPTAQAWGYTSPWEIWLIFPLQLGFCCFFLYALIHNRGVTVWALKSKPLRALGAVVYPFYLFHWNITEITLSGTTWMFEGPFASGTIGCWLPVGGLALTWVVAYLINEYFQQFVMTHVEPCVNAGTRLLHHHCGGLCSIGSGGGSAAGEDEEGGRSLLEEHTESGRGGGGVVSYGAHIATLDDAWGRDSTSDPHRLSSFKIMTEG